jgi:DNA-binding NarL/FixJ family response regulator
MKRAQPPQKQQPADVQVSRFSLGGDEYLVVSRPVEAVANELSEAELRVAELVARGLSNEEVATLRSTSVRTVANQVAEILRKLEVPSRHHVAQKIGSR